MKEKKQAFSGYSIAFCSLMAAIGAIIMLLGGIIPVLTYCSPMVASLVLEIIIYEFNRKHAIMVWAVTAAIALIICPDRESALFYVFLGHWPLVKGVLDSVELKPLRMLIKIVIITLLLAAMYGIACFVLGITEIIETFYGSALLDILLTVPLIVVMMIFDEILTRFDRIYPTRIRPRLRLRDK